MPSLWLQRFTKSSFETEQSIRPCADDTELQWQITTNTNVANPAGEVRIASFSIAFTLYLRKSYLGIPVTSSTRSFKAKMLIEVMTSAIFTVSSKGRITLTVKGRFLAEETWRPIVSLNCYVTVVFYDWLLTSKKPLCARLYFNARNLADLIWLLISWVKNYSLILLPHFSVNS